MTHTIDDELHRGENERIRLTALGHPADAWDGLEGSSVHYVLTGDDAGKNIVLEIDDSDAAFEILEDGGGDTPAEIVVDLDREQTADLPRTVYQWLVVDDVGSNLTSIETDPFYITVRTTPGPDVVG